MSSLAIYPFYLALLLSTFHPSFCYDLCIRLFLSFMVHTDLGQSLSDFGKAVKLPGACEGNSFGKAFTELGVKSEALSVKLLST